MQAEARREVRYSLEMNEAEALWLKARMQNACDCGCDCEEGSDDAEMRGAFFHAMRRVLPEVPEGSGPEPCLIQGASDGPGDD